MPNDLVFNNVASDLKTQIYGSNTSTPVQQDANGNLMVTMSGNAFTESNLTIADFISSTVTAMTQNTSQQNMYSFYVTNTSANTATAWLQISPTDVETYFVNDSTGKQVVAPSSSLVLVPKYFLKYTRVMLQNSTTATTSAFVYYNAQV